MLRKAGPDRWLSVTAGAGPARWLRVPVPWLTWRTLFGWRWGPG